MTETTNTIIAGTLIAAGVGASANLVRIFIWDWLKGRREQRQRAARRRRAAQVKPSSTSATRLVTAMPARRWSIAAALAALGVPWAHAHAQASDGPITPSATSPTSASPLAAAQTLSFQPPEPAGTQTPPAASDAKPLTISADRPGFSDSSGIAPVGHLQLETGYTFTFRNREGVESQTHNAPEITARVGLLDDRLELRLVTAGYVWSRSDAGAGFDSIAGFSDLAAGVKLKINDQDGALPRLALEGLATLGLGSQEISNRDLEPTVKLIASWDLGSGFTLTSNAVLSYATTSGSRFLQGAGSASLSCSVSDRASVFVEYFVIGPRIKGSDAAHALDLGGAYLLNRRVQLDARIGFGLNREADNLFAGCGVSVLF